LRKRNFSRRGCPRFLNETVNDTDATRPNEKYKASNAIIRERAGQFPQPRTERPAQRHADRPPDLNRSKVGPDDSAIFGRQAP
jgi:hypothetical protein